MHNCSCFKMASLAKIRVITYVVVLKKIASGMLVSFIIMK